MTGIAAGLHALCELPPGLTEDQVVARAAARGLEVEGLARYRATGSATNRATDQTTGAGREQAGRQALVIGYGSPPEHSFSGAVARLCAALNDPA